MTRDEMIEAIAKPILEHLEKMEENLDSEEMTAVPQLKLLTDEMPEKIVLNGFELDKPFLKDLEAYIVDQMQWHFPPTRQH